jgi:hypothetical protein
MEQNCVQGKEAEDLVEKICNKMFFSDFTVRNPKFKNARREEKEAADILIPFDNYLLAFQVKTKIEKKSATQKTDVDYKRIERVIEKAIDQLKTIKHALSLNRITELTTVRGYTIPFTCASVEKLIGVVIIDLVGEENFPKTDQTLILNGFTVRNDIPTHIFMRYEFEAISSEIDTLPDFVDYLMNREVLYGNNMFLVPPHELDLLSMCKLYPERVQKATESQANIIVEDGIWEQYQDQFADEIKKRNELNGPSYMIDQVINWLHSSVGFELNTEVLQHIKHKFQGTIEGYLAISIVLAKIPRLQRRLIGEKMLRCLRQADDIGHGHSLIVDKYTNSGVLVISISGTREQRARALYNLAAMAYCGYNLKKLLGIATEPLTVHLRSYDVVHFDGVRFENCIVLKEEAKTAFGPTKEAIFFEYLETDLGS